MSQNRLNEPFIILMEKLADIMMKKSEPFRARAYQKAQETIMSYNGDIKSPNDLKGQPGIGNTIMDKLNEYVTTGTLSILEAERNNPINVLSEVYGIGPKKAKELVDNGIHTISQLRENQHLLNDIQKVGLHYYEDILKRIPRKEIEAYKMYFNKAIPKIADVKMEIVGSYRRGADTSGDIDVIITSHIPQVFNDFIDNLLKQKVILHILSRGPTKCLVITNIPGANVARRVDFLYTNPQEFPFAILYFTGSKIFNTVMRHIALENGYTMNEHGIYKIQSNKKGEKVERSFHTEKDIFDFLNLEYKEPHERIDGRAIIKVGHEPVKEIPNSQLNNYIKEFKLKGISVLEHLTEKQLSDILIYANDVYYNSNNSALNNILTDYEYDIIKEYVSNQYPKNEVVNEVGAPVQRDKVTLPYYMGSMDKIKPDTSALNNWTSKFKGPYLLSCKLDGASALYTTERNSPKLYSRGNGQIGQDISHLIPYLRLPKIKNIVIRGELIIPKNVFQEKYKDKFANTRNMVSGIINHKTVHPAINDVHFVAYEVIKPVCEPFKQIELLSKLDIHLVSHKFERKLTNELLSETLIDWRLNYVYEMDGVIVTNNAIYERKMGNPEYAFAFKMVLGDQIAEAKVVDVLWTPSKDGYLKPRVQIEPIQLGGVKITHATGFNGSYIYNNKIGVGTVIEIIRSGDVIPHISKVIIPADNPKMPLVPFKWNDTCVDIMLEDMETDETVKEKNITGFFKGIGVDGLSSGNIKRIMNAGYDSVPKILRMEVFDFLKVQGFKDKMATKLYDGIIEKIHNATLIEIMSASNLFGRGFSEKKIELIMDAYPNILLSNETTDQKITKLSSIKGMAYKTSEAFIERIPYFITFIKEAGLVNKLSILQTQKLYVNEEHPLFGKSIVLTGFRDEKLQHQLKELGAKIGASVSSKTFVVLVKNKDEDTGKASDARKLGIPLMTVDEFINKYQF